MLVAGLDGGKNTSDLGGVSEDISDNYYAYIDSILGGDLPAADKSGDKLLGALVDYSAITLSESARNTLSALYEEREALLSSMRYKRSRMPLSVCHRRRISLYRGWQAPVKQR